MLDALDSLEVLDTLDVLDALDTLDTLAHLAHLACLELKWKLLGEKWNEMVELCIWGMGRNCRVCVRGRCVDSGRFMCVVVE